ncbi:Enhancer binding protein 2 (EBP2) [Entamoeba marina]
MAKLYVGNLSYSTREEEMQKYFAVFGSIKECHLMVDRGYSKGFGFVEYDNEDDMKKALEKNGTEFMGRKLRIEEARPPKEHSDNQRNSRPPYRSYNGPRKFGYGQRKYGYNGPRRSYGYSGPRRNYNYDGPRRNFNYRKNFNDNKRYGNPQSYRRYEKDQKKPTEPSDFSDKLLFVKNLPYSVRDEKLGELFSGHGVVKATVVTYRKGPNVLSKGFGFVEVDSTKHQSDAIAALNNQEVDGRQIVVVKAFKTQEHEMNN